MSKSKVVDFVRALYSALETASRKEPSLVSRVIGLVSIPTHVRYNR